MTLISLHLPKTAGTSFYASLEKHYGNGILRDYADFPINTPVTTRIASALGKCVVNGISFPGKIECVHGHFLPLKYLLCRKARYVTWLRDPIERLASHYYYWQRKYDRGTAQALRRRVVEEKWSLERFCLGPELRNFYSQFLWGFPIRRFDFVGITEHYQTEMEYFSRQFLGTSLEVFEKNTNPDRGKESYFQDEGLRKEVGRYHARDVELYQRALEMRLRTRSS